MPFEKRTRAMTYSTTSSPTEISEALDVAIVGAGISGLYSAWRLSEPSLEALGQTKPLKISIFDAENRTGGRLYSLNN